MNLWNNAINVGINEPYFIFGLTNLQVYEMCVLGITNLRNNEPHPSITGEFTGNVSTL